MFKTIILMFFSKNMIHYKFIIFRKTKIIKYTLKLANFYALSFIIITFKLKLFNVKKLTYLLKILNVFIKIVKICIF